MQLALVRKSPLSLPFCLAWNFGRSLRGFRGLTIRTMREVTDSAHRYRHCDPHNGNQHKQPSYCQADPEPVLIV